MTTSSTNQDSNWQHHFTQHPPGTTVGGTELAEKQKNKEVATLSLYVFMIGSRHAETDRIAALYKYGLPWFLNMGMPWIYPYSQEMCVHPNSYRIFFYSWLKCSPIYGSPWNISDLYFGRPTLWVPSRCQFWGGPDMMRLREESSDGAESLRGSLPIMH